MRIIGGEYKSRRIYSAPAGTSKGFRPASDRTRETVFNILTHRIELDNAVCLDLFSGTGAYGFEAISRRAASCDFVEISSRAIELIRKTSNELGCVNKINIIKSEVIKFLKSNTFSYDIIFADPPYKYNKYAELIRLVFKRKFRVFILEHSKDAEINDIPDGLNIINKSIGRTRIKIITGFPLSRE